MLQDKPPKIRADLIIQEIKNKDGSFHYVIKDPITNAFFKVGEAEHFIIRNLDGITSISAVAGLAAERFGVAVSDAEISGFISELEKLCFLDNELGRQELLRRQKTADGDRPKTLFGRLVFFKIKAFDPRRLLDRLVIRARVFFTKEFVALAVLTIAFSTLITLYNLHDIADGFWGLMNFQGIVIIYLSMFAVVLLHEFAHGLTCKHYGGDVREMGMLFIYFQPAFYCNVSDAWLFPEKRKRLWVSFSGGFIQIFIWAVAVLVWRATQQDLLINKISLAVLSFAGIATLFNFNPLLRYDGYYLLSDYAEIPNLRKKARDYWITKIRKLFFGNGSGLPDLSRRERKVCFYYGILSFFYIVFVLGIFFLKAGQFLVSRLGGAGILIFAAAIIFLFRNIITGAVKEMAGLLRARAGTIKRHYTLAVIILLIISCAVLANFVKWELRIKGDLVINPVRAIFLKYNNLGYAQLIRYDADQSDSNKQRQISIFGGDYTTTSLVPLVGIDDKVEKDQTIARLANTETSRLIDEYTASMQKAEEELAILVQGARPEEVEHSRNNLSEIEAQFELAVQNLKRKNEMLGRQVISQQDWEDAYADSVIWAARVRGAKNQLELLLAGSRPEEIRAKEAEINRLKGQIESLKKQQDFYEIRSSVSGVVLSLDTGEVALEIAELDTLAAEIMLSEKDLAYIKEGLRVKFKARSYPFLSFYGTVCRVGNKIIEDSGGRRIFKVECRIPNTNNVLKPGMSGVAVIYCGPKKISYLIYRKFFRTIRTEFWDWFDWL
jgi:putative peptide zinc metalloprotease protein